MKGAGHPMGNSDGGECWGAVGFVGSCSTWKQPVLFPIFWAVHLKKIWIEKIQDVGK